MSRASLSRLLFAAGFLLLAGSVHGQTITAAFPFLNHARDTHTATLLQDGRVFVAGGYVSSNPSNEVEILDTNPPSATSATYLQMSTARANHTATLLQNGKILITGGLSGTGPTNSAEIYNPATNTIAATGNLNTARYGHTATLLRDGKVLITGGQVPGMGQVITNTAELYDPSAGTFTLLTSHMQSARVDHAAVLLQNGNVLLIGGSVGSFTATATVDLFTPGTNTFSAAASLGTGRFYASATVLDDGRVFIAGGYGGTTLTSTEIYDPATNTMTNGPSLLVGRWLHSATLLPNGKVLLIGGYNAVTPQSSTELFDPSNAGRTSFAPGMLQARSAQTSTLLPSGRVLIIGGDVSSVTEVYDPANESFTTSPLLHARARPTATPLGDGTVLIAGGEDNGTPLQTAEIFDPSTGTYTAAGNMQAPRAQHTATLLPNGKVLIAGGRSSFVLSLAEIFDPVTKTFSLTGDMNVARRGHTATLLADGTVLIAGGYGSNGTAVSSAEIYDPLSGTFTPTGSMNGTRTDHAAVLMPSGQVLLANGLVAGFVSPSTEMFDPNQGTFAFDVNTQQPRALNTATLLANGEVLIAGGHIGVESEVVNPGIGITAAINIPDRLEGKAVLLPNNTVLIAGGQSEASVTVWDPTSQTSRAAVAPVAWRALTSAALLPNGKVLLAGGLDPNFNCCGGPAVTASGVFASQATIAHPRPTLATVGPVCMQTSLALTGTGFSTTEASNGTFQNSATNVPLLRLQNVHDNHLQFIQPTSWSATTLNATMPTLRFGFYRVAVVTNAVASLEQIVDVEPSSAPTFGTYANASTVNAQLATITPTALPDYHGTTGVRFTISVSNGFLGAVYLNGRTGVVTVADPHPAGVYTINLSASTACATTNRSFTLTVSQIQKPVITAAAANSAKVTITWPAIAGAASYEVFRSTNVTATGNAGFAHLGTANTNSYNDTTVGPDTTYVYRVQSIDNDGGGSPLSKSDLATTTIFSDDPVQAGVTTVQAIHIEEARSAVNTVRAACGLGAYPFTDASITGVAIKSVHVQDLRTALNQALSIILGAPISFNNPATAGSLIRAIDLTEIRNGTK